ncbi:hypothetical protein MJG53_006988 [Ovis ammon polii x Ovis aries]|uniref:Uncharacterized protein n=1 Tax=Ovis ammon polii x Ovis aries TaxID=2918886 RepID=A0ACB9V1S9_9CETA|nr:hypothetical protein MJG53_006988 [Ovis ammon polii x Ovis aries]
MRRVRNKPGATQLWPQFLLPAGDAAALQTSLLPWGGPQCGEGQPLRNPQQPPGQMCSGPRVTGGKRRPGEAVPSRPVELAAYISPPAQHLCPWVPQFIDRKAAAKPQPHKPSSSPPAESSHGPWYCPGQGEKNHGFEVLYHSVKQGPISTKELADFIRERATIEETYSKAMAKLSKLASNGTPMGTFAPLWEVFRVSSDKLALCHLELTRKLQDLIKDVLRHGEEQLKAHKKVSALVAAGPCKEEAVGTLDAIQVLTGVSQLLPKSRENYLNRCMDQERLRRESTSQKEMDKAETKTRKAAESLRRLVEKYNSARSDFEQKMLDSALRFQAMEETHLRQMKALMGSYAHSVEDTHVQIGQVHEEFKQNVENVSVEMLLRKFAESKGTGQEKPGPLDFEAYRAATLQEGNARTAESTHFSSSDSDFDDEEPRKIYVHIKPASARAPPCSPKAAAAQLKATAGSLILPPGPGGTMKRHSSHLMPVPADFAVREGLAAPSRRPRSRKASCPLMRSNGDLSRSLSPSPLGSSAPSSIPERPSFTSQTGHGVSRGPSPVVLGSQDALPVATAFTEYVHAYFRGHSPSCLARVTGELTMTFPAGIVRVFSGTPPPPVLSFRLVHTAPIEHFQPNADLLFSDPSQSDPETKDFWLNMTTLTETLQRQAEQNPAASYYNVVLLRYQFSRPGPQSMPLQLSAHWQCGPTLTQVSVEYSYQPGATVVPTPLTNVQILLPVGEPVTNVRLQPAATWNLEEKRLLWKLPDVSEAGGQPRHIRDFLLYKHCRDFALLQEVPPDKCADPVFLLLVIKSSPSNYERRELVRRTWGRERQILGVQLRRLFLVGTDSKPLEARKVNRLLAMEAQTHGDILQWDFYDTFFNLTLKQVLFLQWQKTRCTNASFLLNGDDDVFAHTDNMVAYLQSHNPDQHLFVGHLIHNVGPIRIPWSKYYVPKVVMEEEHYPPYCGGGGFLLSRFTAAALRHASHALDLFPIDDVFLGMCLKQEGLEPASHSGIRTAGVQSPSSRLSSFDPCFYRELLLVHRFLPYEMLLMWDALNQPNLTCGRQSQVY